MALTLLLGGARSGKSALAVRAAGAWTGPVEVVVTAEARDAEMAARIERHRAERPVGWRTVEAPRELEAALREVAAGALVIVDCLTLWVSNLMELGVDDAEVERRALAAAALAASRAAPTLAISNEVGSGIVPADALARRYRDLLGQVNAAWAAAAEQALLLVAGRALPLQDPMAALGGAAPGRLGGVAREPGAATGG
ncbi:MAG TPA: bifunctional adenosylcobinamide kinase/adenosylcobinamide-phosphate guanylyltransferase [Actinomycetota bacterium]|nr:bifunctional adenosylcobinamide kinase/adenosylcobinamide-phosphate guanylyltransferase [Actinomycetota bacterium]